MNKETTEMFKEHQEIFKSLLGTIEGMQKQIDGLHKIAEIQTDILKKLKRNSAKMFMINKKTMDLFDALKSLSTKQRADMMEDIGLRHYQTITRWIRTKRMSPFYRLPVEKFLIKRKLYSVKE